MVRHRSTPIGIGSRISVTTLESPSRPSSLPLQIHCNELISFNQYVKGFDQKGLSAETCPLAGLFLVLENTLTGFKVIAGGSNGK